MPPLQVITTVEMWEVKHSHGALQESEGVGNHVPFQLVGTKVCCKDYGLM